MSEAQLSSILTALEELAGRLESVAESYKGTPRSDVAADLAEVDRSLRTGIRRLQKTLRGLDR